ncbi:putative glyoxalase/Bleomycin resistance protein/Dioxygenase superfamily protein [Lyophyllum shimeji]|uniref:Glyoxalase/Bleomycin resistance protein/Dioxygenase superfamily protein n=1 Tax=Lyophyllum shimeji TaxID=47721 RepID=A0A9P3PHY4_LYOSH|nr:putative glyoxalase/Bleomycin resistance protein/Dioxygenase superfamily protein [Lyophyllum shimeji]
MTISHVGIQVTDVQQMTDFYLAALKPLGYAKRMEPAKDVIGMGPRFCGPTFWLSPGLDLSKKPDTGEQLHIAFHASNRQKVRDFHAAALKAGGTCNGAPGIREQYFPTYYAAYVLDPEGRNIEAHCMAPAFVAEPVQRNIIFAVSGAIVAAAVYWARTREMF